MVKVIANISEFDAVVKASANASKLIVVDFFATWCGPCVRIAPQVEKWSEEFKDSVIFLKVDVDQAEDVAAASKIEAMPTFVLFKDSKEVTRIVGANADKILEAIKENK